MNIFNTTDTMYTCPSYVNALLLKNYKDVGGYTTTLLRKTVGGYLVVTNEFYTKLKSEKLKN